jgi:hypothetical protein
VIPIVIASGAGGYLAPQDPQHYLRPGTLQLAALPPLSLYVHIPWCLKKCPYCDFNSHEWTDPKTSAAGTAELPEQRYIEALMADLEAALPLVWGRTVHSVFIGGGTPQPFFAAGDRPAAGRHSGAFKAGLKLRDHAGGQSGHLREKAVSGPIGQRG